MDTRQTAQTIFDSLTDEQLEGFIKLFGMTSDKTKEKKTRAQKAFERLNEIIRPANDLDDNKEKEEYLMEKYGL